MSQLRRHFADELVKQATLAVPRVTLRAGNTMQGAGVPVPQTKPPKPAVVATKTLSKKVPGSVPTASGSNLGTKFSPRPVKAPPASGGTSLVRF